jgi:hypothetical protein
MQIRTPDASAVEQAINRSCRGDERRRWYRLLDRLHDQREAEIVEPGLNPAARQRFGRETPSNKASRFALEATGALVVLAALAVVFASPSHAGTVGGTSPVSGIAARMASVLTGRRSGTVSSTGR